MWWIEFGATNREIAVTTTKTTNTKTGGESIPKRRKKLGRIVSLKPSWILKAELMTKHLQRIPTHENGQGRPLPSRGTPLTNLTTVKLNRKRCPKTSGRTCVERMFCKVHPELYVPPLTQPKNNAPDLYHFTRLGVQCWFEVEQSKMAVFWLAWSDLLVWCGCGGLFWWADFGGLVWELVHGLICSRIWDSSDCLVLWSDLMRILWAALVVWFYGLIWRSEWGRWSGLTAEN